MSSDSGDEYWKKFERGISQALLHPEFCEQGFLLWIMLLFAHDLNDRQVVKIDAPRPDAWKCISQWALRV